MTSAALPSAEIALVDIDAPVVRTLAAWQRPSLAARFGDYRPPGVQSVGFGDAVQIVIWETGTGSLFSGTVLMEQGSPGARSATIPEQLVGRDGTIQVPYAGRIKVTGLTPKQIEELVVTRLGNMTVNPQALVNVTRSVSQSVTVTGEVTSGVRIPLTAHGDKILDVIASAGGIKIPVYEASVALTRRGSTVTMPMQTLLSVPAENIYLRPGDTLTVVREPQSFTAVGAAGRQALIPFDASGLSLEEAIGKAGGLIDERSDPGGVFVLRFELPELAEHLPGVTQELVRKSAMVPVAYRLNFKDPASLFNARQFVVRNKDILYVSPAPITKIEQVLRITGLLTGQAATVSSMVVDIAQ